MSQNRRAPRRLTSVIAGLALTLVVPLSAAAQPPRSDAPAAAAVVAPTAVTKGAERGALTTTVRRVSDPVCQAAVRSHRETASLAQNCAAEDRLTLSEPRRVTTDTATSLGDPSTPSGQRLSVVARASAVYYQTWTQERRGLYYVNWYEKHEGLYYFDYTYAWVSPRYGWDAHGYHQCDLGYGILYDIQVKECSVRGNMTSTVIARDSFRVHVVWRGFPLFVTHTMDAYLPKSGL